MLYSFIKSLIRKVVYMYVFHFFIEVFSKKTKNIKDTFIKKYVDNSSNPQKFIDKSKDNWNEQKSILRSLFVDDDLVVTGTRQGVNYYIFDTNQTDWGSKNNITFEILVISNIEIDDSINIIIKDIKEIFNEGKKIRKNGKIKVLKNNKLYIFPFNVASGDIYDPTHKIQAGFEKRKLSLWEKIRILLFSGLAFVTGSLGFLNIGSSQDIIIYTSIFASVLVFILSELLIKILPYIDTKLHVTIDNLSDFIQPNIRDDLYSNDRGPGLENPPEGDNQ